MSLSKTKQSTAYLTLEALRSSALKKAALTPSCQVRAIALFMVWLCLTVQLDPLYAPVPTGVDALCCRKRREGIMDLTAAGLYIMPP